MGGYFYQHPDLSEFISLIEEKNQETMVKNDDVEEDGEEKRQEDAREKTLGTKKMIAASRRVYGILSEVLGRSLCKLTLSVMRGDGGALWLAIRKKFCSTTAISKLKVVIEFITLSQVYI